MSHDMMPPYIAFECDGLGFVQEIIRDDFGLAELIPGQTLGQLVDSNSRVRLLNFLVELRGQGAAFDWEMYIPINGQVDPMRIAGALDQGSMVIVFAHTLLDALTILDGLVKNNDEQATPLRTVIEAQMQSIHAHNETIDSIYNEISRMNNELVTVQHELARKNAELQRLNLEIGGMNKELDLRLEKRTSELEQNQKSQQELLINYRIVADNTYDWEYWMDADEQYLYTSPSCKRISGYEAKDFLNNPDLLMQIIHPDDLPAWQKHRNEELLEKIETQIEFRIRRANGTTCWIGHVCQPVYDDQGRFLGSRGTNRDITEIKRAEQELRTSETQFKTLFQNINSSASLYEVILDEIDCPCDYRFIAVNPEYEKSIGIKASELVGKSLLGVFPMTEPFWLEKFSQVNLTGKPERIENYSREVNKYFEMIVYAPQKGQMALIGSDITERKRADGQREALLEIMQGLAVTQDLQEILALIHHSIVKVISAENFFVVFHNKETGLFEEVYAVDQHDPPAPPSRLDKSITAYVYRSQKPLIMTQELFDDLVAQGEVELVGTNSPSWLGAPLTTPEGTIGVIAVQDYEPPNRYSEQDKEFLAYIASQVALAIERKLTDEALRQSEERFRKLSEDMPVYIDTFLPDGTLTYANAALAAMTGISAAEMVGLNLFAMLSTEDRKTVKTHLGLLMPDHPIETHEQHYQTPEGDARWQQWINRAFFDAGGQLLFYQAIGQDITEQKIAEEALKESNEKLEQLFELLPVGISVLDRERKIVKTNPALEKILGVSREGMRCGDYEQRRYFRPDGSLMPTEELASSRILRGETRVLHVETGVEKEDGVLVWTDVSAVASPFSDWSVVIVTADITERKRTEMALSESEIKYRRIMETAMEGILVLDRQDQIVLINPQTASMFGYTVEAMIGQKLESFVAEEERGNYQTQRNLRRQGKNAIFERFFRRKDGEKFWTLVSANAIMDAEGRFEGSLGMLTDITGRKQAEEALRQSEEKYRHLIENSHDIIYTLTAEGVFTFVSPAWTVLLGHLPSHVVGQSFQQFVHTDDIAGCMAWLKKVIETDSRQEGVEYRVRHLDGSWYWHTSSAVPIKDETGATIGFEGTARDITERKQAEEALRLETIFNHAIFNSVPGVLYLYDEQGHLLRWNKKHEEMTGYSSAELDHFYILDWYKDEPEDIDRVSKGIQKALTEGFATAEANLITKSGSKILFDFTAARLDIGDKVYYTGIGIDITARRKIEKQVEADQVELQHLLAEAEHSRRMLLSVVEDQREAEEQIQLLNTELEERVADRTAQLTAANQELEAFSYSVSHDLRAPLRSLDGFSALLLSDYGGVLDEQGQNFLHRIQEASRRMGELINDLLDLSRVTRTEMSFHPVDLSKLAQAIADELSAQDPQRRVAFDISDNIVVEGDPDLLKIVLENLLNNAYKFTGQRQQAAIQVGMLEQTGECIYFVRDNGTGFNMEHADKLFAPFQRLHSIKEYPGTGIGLSIVQRIITRHGGRIWPESEIGQGATFYFTLKNRD